MAVHALPSSMRAQFLEAFNTPYTLRTVPLPVLTSPHDMLIKVDAASYCHTDAVLAAGGMAPNPPAFPHVGCHEFAGTVVATSHSATLPHSFQPGDRVGVPGRSFHACGTCFECRAAPGTDSHDSDPPGYSVYCAGDAANLGISAPGGFQEYAAVDARQVAPVPPSMSAPEAATLMCAGVTIYAALKRCGVAAGGRVGIVGCGGGLGHLGLQFAAAMGLRVVGVDNADAPLDLARRVVAVRGVGGVVRVVDARVEEAEDVVTKLGQEDGRRDRADMGVDAVVILPESQRAFDYGVALLRNHGRCVVVSFPRDGFRLASRDVVFRDISVVGSLVGSNRVLREMVLFAAVHGVRASFKLFPLDRLNELVEEYHKGAGGKLVVDMTA
ncbi:chaperonin 10-like protein [Lasiosphaeria ovina]|uniref:Chaperonin 10-like protein n=1 Tax=Lasiosphaeria ovina TaxID=92902 RepID=A0AAE0KA83_9PEZI|nr:chaperonin 10-like protein [Lasiosphaeria ovina]